MMFARAVIIYLAAILGLCLLLWALTPPSNAADADHMDMYHGDPRYDQWFRSLRSPTGVGCCSLSDCERTEAEWRDDTWFALVNGEMVPVPAEAIVHTPLSIDGDAYVCLRTVPDSRTGSMIRCFVPAIPGY